MGDTYRLLLTAIAQRPPSLSFDINELDRRLKNLCDGGRPSKNSLRDACRWLPTGCRDARRSRARLEPGATEPEVDMTELEWDDHLKILHVTDPYLIFYLRWSDFLPNTAP